MRISFLTPQAMSEDGRLEDEIITSVAELVGYNIDPVKVETWTHIEKIMAYDFFMRLHLRASDNIVRHRPAPSFVTQAQIA